MSISNGQRFSALPVVALGLQVLLCACATRPPIDAWNDVHLQTGARVSIVENIGARYVIVAAYNESDSPIALEDRASHRFKVLEPYNSILFGRRIRSLYAVGVGEAQSHLRYRVFEMAVVPSAYAMPAPITNPIGRAPTRIAAGKSVEAFTVADGVNGYVRVTLTFSNNGPVPFVVQCGERDHEGTFRLTGKEVTVAPGSATTVSTDCSVVMLRNDSSQDATGTFEGSEIVQLEANPK